MKEISELIAALKAPGIKSSEAEDTKEQFTKLRKNILIVTAMSLLLVFGVVLGLQAQKEIIEVEKRWQTASAKVVAEEAKLASIQDAILVEGKKLAVKVSETEEAVAKLAAQIAEGEEKLASIQDAILAEGKKLAVKVSETEEAVAKLATQIAEGEEKLASIQDAILAEEQLVVEKATETAAAVKESTPTLRDRVVAKVKGWWK